MEVSHGRPIQRHKIKVVTPEFIIIRNFARSTKNLSGWYITDHTEKGKRRWAGEGLVKFPKRTILKTGEYFVVENRPHPTVSQAYRILLSYRDFYGRNPDYVILPKGHKTTSLKQLIHIKGAVRLKGISAWYEDRGSYNYDRVWLIRKSRLSDEQVADHLVEGTLPKNLIVASNTAVRIH